MAKKKQTTPKDSPFDALIRKKDQELSALMQEATTAILCDENDEADRLTNECSDLAEELRKLLDNSTQQIKPGGFADSYNATLKGIEEDLAWVKEDRAKEKEREKRGLNLDLSTYSKVTEIHLEPATDADFQNLRKIKEWTKLLLAADFSLCGDYSLPELSTTLRGFFHPPNTFANILEKNSSRWLEIDVHYANETIETWSNVPLVLPSAPWRTMHIEQKAKVDELVKMMKAKRSSKKRACFTASDFAKVYQNVYERHVQWRASTGNPIRLLNVKPIPKKKRPAKTKTVLSDKQKTAVSKCKKANPTFKLSKSDWEEIARYMDQLDGNKSLKEIADEHQRKYLKAAMKNTKGSYPGCSEKEHIAILMIHWLDSFLIRRGVARRISLNDPAELAICACLDARFDWLQSHENLGGEGYPNLRTFLSGLSAGDIAVAQRFTETGLFPIKKGSSDMIYLYNGIFAVLRKDKAYLKMLAPHLKKPKGAQWIAAMIHCLRGIAENSPDLVAEGLNKILATCRQSGSAKLEKIISINAHAFYHLSRWVSPKLVSKFDADQPLPWDAEYARWVLNNKDPMKFIDLKNISPVLHKWVSTLCEPCFWNCPEN